jgi:hypothetical protein
MYVGNGYKTAARWAVTNKLGGAIMADEKMCDNPRCSRKFTPKNARHICCSPKCAEERRRTVILIGEKALKHLDGVSK